MPFPSPRGLPDPEIEHEFPASPALAGRFFTSEPLGKPQQYSLHTNYTKSVFFPQGLFLFYRPCLCTDQSSSLNVLLLVLNIIELLCIFQTVDLGSSSLGTLLEVLFV